MFEVFALGNKMKVQLASNMVLICTFIFSFFCLNLHGYYFYNFIKFNPEKGHINI